MQEKNDIYIIEKVLKGEASAYAQLVRKYQRMAYTLALRIVRQQQDAEEIAQDAFVKAFQNLKTFKKQSKFSTWLFRIVYNESLSLLRKKKREIVVIEDGNLLKFDIQQSDNLLEILHRKERETIVKEAMNRLPDDERAILTLFYFNECEVSEIMEVTGFSESNVKIKLFRGRKRLWNFVRFIND